MAEFHYWHRGHCHPVLPQTNYIIDFFLWVIVTNQSSGTRVYPDADYVGSLVVDGPSQCVTEYEGSKEEPADWWETFWQRFESNTGLQLARVSAINYPETLWSDLFAGNRNTVECLPPAVLAVETSLKLGQQQRRRTAYRLHDGSGTDDKLCSMPFGE